MERLIRWPSILWFFSFSLKHILHSNFIFTHIIATLLLLGCTMCHGMIGCSVSVCIYFLQTTWIDWYFVQFTFLTFFFWVFERVIRGPTFSPQIMHPPLSSLGWLSFATLPSSSVHLPSRPLGIMVYSFAVLGSCLVVRGDVFVCNHFFLLFIVCIICTFADHIQTIIFDLSA